MSQSSAAYSYLGGIATPQSGLSSQGSSSASAAKRARSGTEDSDRDREGKVVVAHMSKSLMLGVACYDPADGLILAHPDMQETESLHFLGSIMDAQQPEVVVVSSKVNQAVLVKMEEALAQAGIKLARVGCTRTRF